MENHDYGFEQLSADAAADQAALPDSGTGGRSCGYVFPAVRRREYDVPAKDILTQIVFWFGAVRGRTGLVVDDLLLYVTGGVAYAKFYNLTYFA